MAEGIKFEAEADISPLEQMNSALRGLDSSFGSFANTVSALDKQSSHLTTSVQSVAKQLNELSSAASGKELDSFNQSVAKAATGTEKLAPIIQKDIDAFQQLWKTINDSPLERFNERTSNPVFTAQIEGTKYFIKVLSDAGIAAEVTSNKLAKLLSIQVADVSTVAKSAISNLPEDRFARLGTTALVSQEVKGTTFEHADLDLLEAHKNQFIKQYLKEAVFGRLINDFDRNTGNVIAGKTGPINLDFESTFANTQRELASILEHSALFKNVLPINELRHRLGTGQALQALPIPRDFIDEIVEKETEIRRIVSEGIKDPEAVKLFNQRLQKVLSLKNVAQPKLVDLLLSEEEIDAFKDIVSHLSRGKGVVQDPTLQKKLDDLDKENLRSFSQVAGVGPGKGSKDDFFNLVPKSAAVNDYTRSVDVAASATINLKNKVHEEVDEFAKLRASSGNVLEPVSTELRGSNALFTTTIEGTKFYVKVLEQEQHAAELAATAIGRLLNQKVALSTEVKTSQFAPTDRKVDEPYEKLIASVEVPGKTSGFLDSKQRLKEQTENIRDHIEQALYHFIVNETDRQRKNVIFDPQTSKRTNIDYNAAFQAFSASIGTILDQQFEAALLPTKQIEKLLGDSSKLAIPIPKDYIDTIVSKEAEIRAIATQLIKDPDVLRTFEERFQAVLRLKDIAKPIFAHLLADPEEIAAIEAKLAAFKGKSIVKDATAQKAFNAINATNEALTTSRKALDIPVIDIANATDLRIGKERDIGTLLTLNNTIKRIGNSLQENTVIINGAASAEQSLGAAAQTAATLEKNAADSAKAAEQDRLSKIKEVVAAIDNASRIGAGVGKPPPPLPPAPPGAAPEDDPLFRKLINDEALAAAKRADLIAGEVHIYKEAVKDKIEAEEQLIFEIKKRADAAKTAAVEENTKLKEQLAKFEQLDTVRKAAADREAAAPGALNNALGKIGVSDNALAGLSPDRVNAARTTISQLAEALRSGKLSVDDLNKAVNALNTGSLTPLSVEGARAASALASLQNTVKATGETTKTTGKAILISLEGLIRIAERFFFGRFLYGIVDLFKQSFSEAVKLETAFTKIQIVLESTNEATEKLKDNTLALARQFGASTSSASAATYQVLAGRIGEVSDATNTLETALKLSKVTFSTTEEAAKTLIDALKQYNLSSADQERVAAQLFVATTKGRTSLKDIDDLLGHTAVGAHGLGLSLTTIINAYGSLVDRGIPAARATQTLTSLFGRLNQSGAELASIFNKFGYESSASAVQGLGLAKVLQIIVEEAKNGAGRTKALAQSIIDTNPDIVKLASGISSTTKELERYNRASTQVADTSNEKWLRLSVTFKQIAEHIAEGAKNILIFGASKTGFFDKSQLDETEEQLNKLKTSISDLKNVAKDSDISPLEQSIRQAFADRRKEALEFTLSFRKRFINNSETDLESFDTLAQGAKKTLQDINREIKESQKFATNFAASIEKRSFERRISGLPEGQASVEIQKKIRELNARAQASLFKGDKDAAHKDFEEIGSLIERNTDLGLKFYKNLNTAATAYNKETRKHLEDLQSFSTKQSKLTKEEIRDFDTKADIAKRYAQSAYKNPLQKFLVLQEIEATKFALLVKRLEAERQGDLAKGGKTFKGFDSFDKDQADSIKRNVKDPEAERAELIKDKLKQQVVDPQKLIEQLNELKSLPKVSDIRSKELEDALNKATNSATEFAKVPTLENYNKLIVILDSVKIKLADINKSQGNFNPDVIKAREEFTKDTFEKINQLLNKFKQTTENITEIDAKIKAINDRLGLSFSTTQEIADSLKISTGHFKSINNSVDAFNTGLTQSLKTLSDIENILRRVKEIENTKPEGAAPSKKVLDKAFPAFPRFDLKETFNPTEIKDQLTALQNLVPGTDPLDRIFDTKRFKAGENVKGFAEHAKDLVDVFNQTPNLENFNKATQAIRDTENTYRALLSILQNTLTKESFESTSAAFDNITEALNRLQEAMKKTIEGKNAFKLPNAGSFAPDINPNITPGYASAPSFSPSFQPETGFIPQTAPINNPQIPNNSPNNINNNITIGDIVVRGNDNPQATAREIGQQLVREIKRGLIDLG